MHPHHRLSLILSLLLPTLAHSQPPIDFAKLDPAQIPAAERFPWQPKELVAVRGTHAWKGWGSLYCVAYSPDGKILASGGSGDGLIRLWDQAGHELAALQSSINAINSVAFSPDGSMLLAGGEETLIHVWDIRSTPPKRLPDLKPSNSVANRPPQMMFNTAIDSIAFTPDGKRLACTIGRQAGVRVILWDSSTWPPRELPAPPWATGPFAFGRDSKTLVTQEQMGSIIVWDISAEKPAKLSEGKLGEQRNQMLCMALSPDGKSVVTCHVGGSFRMPNEPQGDMILWDLTANPPKPKAHFGEFKQDSMFWMIPAAAFTPDGKQFLFAAKANYFELWDVSAQTPKKLHTLPGRTTQSGCLAFSPDGKTLAGVGNSILHWDLSGATPRALQETDYSSLLSQQAFMPPYHLDQGEYGKKIESITRKTTDGKSKSWKLSLPEGHHLHPFAFSADGNVLAAKETAYNNVFKDIVKLWNLHGDSPRELASFTPEPVPGVIIEIDAATKEQRVRDSGEKRPFRLWNLALSPDGKTLVAAELEGAMQFWDVSTKTPKLLSTHTGHKQEAVMGAVQQMIISSDGKKLATVGSDRKLIIWEMPTGKKLYTTSFPGVLLAIQFSPDGNHLITLNPNNTNYILRLP